MRRPVKWLIFGIIIAIVVVGIGLLFFFSFRHQDTYKICGLEHTEYTVADFVENSELQLYNNGTFHIRIEHKTKGLSFLGIGTYTEENGNCVLTFTKAIDHQGAHLNLDPVVCNRVNNRIKFVDPNNFQVYYFG